MEQFLWGDRLSTADSEISPRMHRESAKGSGAFLFIRAFFPPSYTLWKTSFHTLTQMKTLTQRAFWRQDFFPLLVWSEILDDVPCYPRACNLEFTLWRPAYHPHRVFFGALQRNSSVKAVCVLMLSFQRPVRPLDSCIAFYPNLTSYSPDCPFFCSYSGFLAILLTLQIGIHPRALISLFPLPEALSPSIYIRPTSPSCLPPELALHLFLCIF